MPIATFPGRPRLGLRRRLHVGAAPRVRRARTASRGSSTPRTRRARGVPRRRLQPRRSRLGGAGRVRPVLHRPLRDVLGRRDRLLAATGCASGRSRTPSTGCATTTSTGCVSTRCTRSSTTRAPHVLAELADRVQRGRSARAGDLGDGDRRPAAARGVGPRRAVGRRVPPRGARPRHRRARRLLRGLRLASPTSPASSTRPQRRRLVVCAQNHDQVGNRAFGDRLHRRELARWPRSARSSLPASRCCSWARSTTSRTRSSSSPTTSTPRSPRPPGTAGGGSSKRSRPSPARTCPTRRPSRRSRARSSIARMRDPDHRRYYRALLALRRRLLPALPVEAVTRRRGAPACCRRAARPRASCVMNFSRASQSTDVPPLDGSGAR